MRVLAQACPRHDIRLRSYAKHRSLLHAVLTSLGYIEANVVRETSRMLKGPDHCSFDIDQPYCDTSALVLFERPPNMPCRQSRRVDASQDVRWPCVERLTRL
jgi:hypothetical protein